MDSLAAYSELARSLSVPCPSCGGSGHWLGGADYEHCQVCGGKGKLWPLLTQCDCRIIGVGPDRDHATDCTGLVPIYALVLGEREVPLDRLLQAIRGQYVITQWGNSAGHFIDLDDETGKRGSIKHAGPCATPAAALLAALSAAQAARGAV